MECRNDLLTLGTFSRKERVPQLETQLPMMFLDQLPMFVQIPPWIPLALRLN
ncbi:hypothetical protein KIN20_022701 [Parelaphostrongylus tenuis]|uniref:Uncharacterized protein n=1 Tax=Parelaphostrongylus tenuis TaxID=148309 RepID=A0AAD5MUH8_PARTN|nr:hypothetical protein KIN20_022701 [Parelaphostrongylus tenuis]